MCTAVSFVTKDHYFGRNLDYDFSYEESVVITPRNYVFSFHGGNTYRKSIQDTVNRKMNGQGGKQVQHYAMIGVAYIVNDYPLYYDAVNEKGLGMAGLLFAGNAVYGDMAEKNKDNIASYEFIPWILGQCANVEEAKKVLENVHLMDWAFSKELPPSPLHWMIADKGNTIVVEVVADGLKIYDNPVHVLTNNPEFKYHLMNLNNYMGLSAYEPENLFSEEVGFTAYSRGMGAIGLPGDLSSVSRFIKAAFTRMNSVSGESENESISQFFHILGSVEQQRGCVRMPKKASVEAAQKDEAERAEVSVQRDEYEITIYSCCCNTDRGIYYYTTYENQQITGVDMHKENLESDKLVSYPLITKQQIRWQN